MVPLGARAFDLLLYLIQCKDRILPRDEVMAQVWNGVVAGNNNFNISVSVRCKILGAQAIITLTVHGLLFGIDVNQQSFGGETLALPLPDKPSIAIQPLSDLDMEPPFSWLAD
ncbi:MAG: DNA-binding winged helix-turn-helix (wHTH) protein [Paracoccaceae bacterium]